MIAKRILKFQIETTIPIHGSQFAVEGRCCADTIKIDDKFTRSCQQSWHKDADKFSHLSYLKPGEKVIIKVVNFYSIIPGSLGTGEAGTLIIETDKPGEICTDRMLLG